MPGLGFDYLHLAAVGGRVNNFPGGNRSATPIFTGILPFYSVVESGSGYAEPQPQPSVIVVQQPPQTIIVQLAAPQNSEAEPAAPIARASSVIPLPDLVEFIFLRRDGQVILAVAFTTTHERLTYITRDGARRSFPYAELDRDATLQMNEANGTTLVLPD